MSHPDSYWQKVSAAFQEQADEYERWFDNNPIFASELSALLSIKTRLARPRLEIGVGHGLLADKLGISFGIDPAYAPLVKAKDNSIMVCRAIGEELPFADNQLGTVFLLFTVCFLADPGRVFRECRRVLNSKGHLVVGMIPGNNSWGRKLAEKGRRGHPLYRHAQFRNKKHIDEALTKNGFQLTETISTLCQSSASTLKTEHPKQGYDKSAGFVVMVSSLTQ